MKNKKGISPLIATVILVAISVALAATISTYLINKAKEFKPGELVEGSVYCESVTLGYDANLDSEDSSMDFEITRGGDGQILKNIVLVNRGSFAIHKLIITAPGYSTLTTNILIEEEDSGESVLGKIDPGENNKYSIDIAFRDDQTTNIADREINIVPVICDSEKSECVENDKVFVVCPDRKLVINYEELCKRLYEDNEGFNPNDPCGLRST